MPMSLPEDQYDVNGNPLPPNPSTSSENEGDASYQDAPSSPDNYLMQPLHEAVSGNGDALSGEAQKGKMDWKHILAATAAGLGLGLAGHKLSGGNISFGEALGHLGKGYADAASTKALEDRKRGRELHDRQLNMIHEAMQQMQGVDLEKYPRLKELSTKYRDSLHGEKGTGDLLSPKDANEWLGLWATAQGELTKAKDEAKTGEAKRAATAATAAKRASIADIFKMRPVNTGPDSGPALMPTPEGADMMAGEAMGRQFDADQPQAIPQTMQPYLGTGYADRRDIGGIGGHMLSEAGAERRAVATERAASIRDAGYQSRAFAHEDATSARGEYANILHALGNPTLDVPDDVKAGMIDRLRELTEQFKMKPQRGAAAASRSITDTIKNLHFTPRQ